MIITIKQIIRDVYPCTHTLSANKKGVIVKDTMLATELVEAMVAFFVVFFVVFLAIICTCRSCHNDQLNILHTNTLLTPPSPDEMSSGFDRLTLTYRTHPLNLEVTPSLPCMIPAIPPTVHTISLANPFLIALQGAKSKAKILLIDKDCQSMIKSVHG